jgi:Single-stranded DNA-specific exonuclease
MRTAVDRILCAITDRQRIVLYGDYDVDGVTSLALLNEMLCAYGAAPALFLPSRMEEGYGLSAEGIERCWEAHQPQLLIAVDCGTGSRAEVADIRARCGCDRARSSRTERHVTGLCCDRKPEVRRGFRFQLPL